MEQLFKCIQVEIDSDIYEKLALMGMKLGRDNVTDYIKDVIYYQIRREKIEENKK